MTPEEFRRYGRQVVDWIADYMERVEQYPVLSRVAPSEVRSKLPHSPPQVGEPFEAILRDVDEIIMPGITHWQSPNFFAYFAANGSAPAVLGEMLAACDAASRWTPGRAERWWQSHMPRRVATDGNRSRTHDPQAAGPARLDIAEPGTRS